MNKKAFTLVELLAVIAILAIILIIATPIISNIIEETRVKAFSASEKMLVLSANNFIAIEGIELPDQINEIYSISYDSLVLNKYIKKIVDPKSGSECIESSVVIVKTGANKYDYYPNLQCENYGSDTSLFDFEDPTLSIVPLQKLEPVASLTVTCDPDDNFGINFWKYRISIDDGQTYGAWSADIIGDGSQDILLNVDGINKIELYVEDENGNSITTISDEYMILSNDVWNFTYIGVSQSFSILYSGDYKLEVWGAKGGDDGGPNGAKGGYSLGEVSLTDGQTLYAYVGGVGVTGTNIVGGWNGGGNSGPSGSSGSGGGAADFRLLGTALTDRVIVAGGGGGGGYNAATPIADGVGGGLNGGFGNTSVTNAATQNAAGTSSNGNGSLGIGGSHNNDGGGGGGGYYGGGAGFLDQGGGGGSAYIVGLSNAQTISGNAVMPNPSGGTMTGNANSGYARITFLKLSTN